MFLAAVYYFVGMSKLTEEERKPFVKDLWDDLSKGEDSLVKAFFRKFQEHAKDKYKDQVAKVLDAKSYEDMAKAFYELLAEILRQNDLKSMICYCDEPDSIEDKFFFNQILKKELKEKCGFSDALTQVILSLKNSGVGGDRAFQDIEMGNWLLRDALGFRAVDLALIGLASVNNTNIEQKDAVYKNHSELLKSLLNKAYKDLDHESIEDLLVSLCFIGKVLGVISADSFRASYIGPFLIKAQEYLSVISGILLSFASFSCMCSILTPLQGKLESSISWNISPLAHVGIITLSCAFALFNSASWMLLYEKNTSEIFSSLPLEDDEKEWMAFMSFAAKIVLANLACNKTIIAIDEYLGYSSLSSKLIGAMFYTPVITHVLEVADKYIYRYLNQSIIEKGLNDQKDTLINMFRDAAGSINLGITSASR